MEPWYCSRLCFALMLTTCGLRAFVAPQVRVSGGNTLEASPSGTMKVYIYDLPRKFNVKVVQKDKRCLSHMFAAEIYIHLFLLASDTRTLNPDEADWFFTPVYTNCNLTESGLPLINQAPGMMRSAIHYISTLWPYWNRTDGADHFFVVPHDFGACFHYQEKKAVERGILPLLQRATLIQTFGQNGHACFKERSIIIPPYVPPTKISKHRLLPETPRPIFAYFRGVFYDVRNDPKGGYYARGVRASIWENFKSHPLFDISTDHPASYYEDMQRSIFCICPLGWAPWSPRIVEAVLFGCIPVIIADDIVLPFAELIPWDELGIFVKEKDVPKLEAILTSIPMPVILKKQLLLADSAIKQALLFPMPSRAGDAFNQVLNALNNKLPLNKSIHEESGHRKLNAGPSRDLKSW